MLQRDSISNGSLVRTVSQASHDATVARRRVRPAYVGRTLRSARSCRRRRSRWDRRSARVSPPPENASCCADRISPSMISMAISFQPNSQAMRYHTLVARSWGSIGRRRLPRMAKP
jgi:hypothetical protein